MTQQIHCQRHVGRRPSFPIKLKYAPGATCRTCRKYGLPVSGLAKSSLHVCLLTGGMPLSVLYGQAMMLRDSANLVQGGGLPARRLGPT